MRNLMIKAAAWKDARPVELEKLRKDEGQTVVEYALVIGGVSIALIIVLAAAGTGWISKVTSKVTASI